MDSTWSCCQKCESRWRPALNMWRRKCMTLRRTRWFQIGKLISSSNQLRNIFVILKWAHLFLFQNLIVKRNNLIFYGIPNEPREKEHALIGKVMHDLYSMLWKGDVFSMLWKGDVFSILWKGDVFSILWKGDVFSMIWNVIHDLYSMQGRRKLVIDDAENGRFW